MALFRSTEGEASETAIVIASLSDYEVFLDVKSIFGLTENCAEIILSTTGEHDVFG